MAIKSRIYNSIEASEHIMQHKTHSFSATFLHYGLASTLGLAAFSPLVDAETLGQEVQNQETADYWANYEPRIVGGQDANITDFPWQVALMADTFQFCGGSIINERWILTAAHCEKPQLTHIRAGVTNKTDATTGQDIPVLRQIPHPAYNDETMDSDLMLLELASPLNLSGSKAKAIPLMTAQAAASGLQNPGVIATISGWGDLSEGGIDPVILQKADVPIVSNAEASTSYDALYGAGSITANMIAAGFLGTGNVDACQGDSGGPMVVRDSASTFGVRLAGVTSFGEGCARPEYVGIYTRVSQFEEWIVNKMTTGECLLNWAERSYSSLFSPAGATTQFSSPYDYRYYSGTNSYLGVSRTNNHVYYQDAGGLHDVGALSAWLPRANCEPKPTQCLFDWAEQQFPDLFPATQGVEVVSYSYSYRHYPGNNSYLGLHSGDNQIRYLLDDGIMRDAGAYDYWMTQSGCSQ